MLPLLAASTAAFVAPATVERLLKERGLEVPGLDAEVVALLQSMQKTVDAKSRFKQKISTVEERNILRDAEEEDDDGDELEEDDAAEDVYTRFLREFLNSALPVQVAAVLKSSSRVDFPAVVSEVVPRLNIHLLFQQIKACCCTHRLLGFTRYVEAKAARRRVTVIDPVDDRSIGIFVKVTYAEALQLSNPVVEVKYVNRTRGIHVAVTTKAVSGENPMINQLVHLTLPKVSEETEALMDLTKQDSYLILNVFDHHQRDVPPARRFLGSITLPWSLIIGYGLEDCFWTPSQGEEYGKHEQQGSSWRSARGLDLSGSLFLLCRLVAPLLPPPEVATPRSPRCFERIAAFISLFPVVDDRLLLSMHAGDRIWMTAQEQVDVGCGDSRGHALLLCCFFSAFDLMLQTQCTNYVARGMGSSGTPLRVLAICRIPQAEQEASAEEVLWRR
ncbi:hypothetical protein TGPRC2_230660 [Toxoplasma gondii TgCatPRC2]|uniref:Uncharacterized protein n=1 Tax=Toxoplasma gondii TgCatPRC2 TaxID=1130821 RepID=A0A151HE02_TOXGO|nr:hypothetical protein TGPRC2_230660 [Toxoplasma gondii TgCatPRC2]